MSFIGQVCLHIRGICYSDKAPQCNRMTATGQDTDNKRTIYKYTILVVIKQRLLEYVLQQNTISVFLLKIFKF